MKRNPMSIVLYIVLITLGCVSGNPNFLDNPEPLIHCVSPSTDADIIAYLNVPTCENTTELVLLSSYEIPRATRMLEILIESNDTVGCISDTYSTDECLKSCNVAHYDFNSTLSCGDQIEDPGIGVGTFPYCETINAVECDIDPDCYCFLYGIDYDAEFFVHGTWTSDDSPVAVNYSPPSVIYTPFEVTISPIISVRFSTNKLYIVNPDGNELMITIRKDGYVDWIKKNEKSSEIVLPDYAMLTSGKLYVEVIAEFHTFRFEFDVIGVKICRLHDCTICIDALENFSCLHLSQKLWLITILAILVISLMLVFPTITFLWITCIPKFSMRSIKFVVWFLCLPKKFFRSMKAKYAQIETDIENQSNSSDRMEAEVVKFNKVAKRSIPLSTKGLVLLAVISAALACDQGFPLSTSVTECITENSGKRTCSLNINTELTFTRLKDTTCITLLDELSSKAIGSIELKFDSFSETLIQERDYYTSRFGYDIRSISYCSSYSQCSECDTNGVKPRLDLFSQNSMNHPGKTFCRKVPRMNGCSLFQGGCIWSRYALNPSYEIFSVDSINKIQYNAVLKVDFKGMGNNTQTTASLVKPFTSIPYNGGKIQLTVSSVTSNSIEIFGTDKVIRSTNETWIQSTSLKNSPVYENIGDIQSSTPQLLSTLGTGNFIYDTSSVTRILHPDRDEFQMKGNGINNLDPAKKLPFFRSGTYWHVDSDGVIRGIPEEEATLKVQFKTVGVELQFDSNSVCPTGTLVNATGCRNCGSGFSIAVKMKSSCLSGNTRVYTDAKDIILHTNSLYLTEEEGIFVVHGSTSKENNELNLVIAGTNNHKVEFLVKFNAPEFVNLREEKEYSYDNSEHKGGTASSGWGDFFQDMTDWFKNPFGIGWSRLKWYLIAIVAAIVLIITGPILLNYILPVKNKRY